MSQVVEALSSLHGIEKCATSVYKPGANGLTERFNGTIVECLQRHADLNPDMRIKWIQYIDAMSIKDTMYHEKHAPFELLSGTPTRVFGFPVWGVVHLEEEVVFILKRSLEFIHLILVWINSVKKKRSALKVCLNRKWLNIGRTMVLCQVSS